VILVTAWYFAGGGDDVRIVDVNCTDRGCESGLCQDRPPVLRYWAAILAEMALLAIILTVFASRTRAVA